MTEVLSGGIQKLETNCNKKLGTFVNKLNLHSNALKKYSVELKQIAGDLLAKSQQLQKLENIKPENLKCYTVDVRDTILSEMLSHVNAQVTTAFKLINELESKQIELRTEYEQLLASANALQITTEDGSVVLGDSRQKPISYYVEDACRILYTWKLYQKSLDISLNRLEIRNDDSIRQFETASTLPQDLSTILDRYLLFSTFLLIHK